MMIKRIIVFCINYWKLKTNPMGYARSIGVRVGHKTRMLGMELGSFGSEPYLVQIGDNVSIASGVKFITHDGGVWVLRDQDPDMDIIAPIKVGNNVIIGIDSIILPGVIIGDNCVIGAGSVVSRDIPSRTVAAGVPAKPIKTIEEYRKKAKEKNMKIHLLPPDEKKKYLLNRFNIQLDND